MANLPSDECLEQVIRLVQEASRKTMEVYAHAFDVVQKEDGSPLTEADLASHNVLVAGLRSLLSDTPVISEESETQAREGPFGERFWLVDPLDGTKEFVKRTDEFTVNVALICNGVPTLGVVEAPALGTLYAGVAGKGACRINPKGEREPIRVNHDFSGGLRVVGSRSHGNPELMDRYLKDVNVRDFLAVGSSLKFCRIAEGEADLYPRFGRTMEWDTAAGHGVLLAAGGRVDTLDGQPLLYGKPNLANPHFVARAFSDDSVME